MATKKKTVTEVISQVAQQTEETQLQLFDRAMKSFSAQRYREARELFQKAAEGTIREVAHNARLHIKMCDRRMEKPEIQLQTIEDFYNAGVERLNARDLENARMNLVKATELTRGDGASADHVYYALAACLALGGDSRGAYENLKRAIEIDPRNRMAARQDPDFSGVGQQPPLHNLIYPEKAPF
jgi:tetratricopeptide (TPR) repeat protein